MDNILLATLNDDGHTFTLLQLIVKMEPGKGRVYVLHLCMGVFTYPERIVGRSKIACRTGG